jgi:hypothetical protein
MVALETLAYHGMQIESDRIPLDLQSLHSDGANFYQYLKSKPSIGADPLGLYTNEDFFNDATDVLGLFGNPMPGPSDFIRSILNAMVSDYSANLDFDLDWASDWSLPDDDHSRTDNSWVDLAIMRGAYEAFNIDLPCSDSSFNPLDVFASGSDMAVASGGGKSKASPGGARSKRGGSTATARKGRLKHDEFRKQMSHMTRDGWKQEVDIPGVGRPDMHNPHTRQLIELKPFTPSGIARGAKQLQGYLKKLNSSLSGPPWTGRVVYYMP